MNDPYAVLGISPSATDDEVKKAYRSLSKKYHPDANINNPNKDALTEKFKEVQNAYDQIMDMRKKGYTQSSYQSSGYQQGGYSQNNYSQQGYSDFEDIFNAFFNGGNYYQQNTRNHQSQEDMYFSAVRNYIMQGYYEEALNVLSQMSEREARWYYYSAICHANLGSNVTALEHAKTAAAMEPNNQEYANLLAQLQSGRGQYRRRTQTYGSPMGAYGECCYRILIWNLICNCCCGGRMFIC